MKLKPKENEVVAPSEILNQSLAAAKKRRRSLEAIHRNLAALEAGLSPPAVFWRRVGSLGAMVSVSFAVGNLFPVHSLWISSLIYALTLGAAWVVIGRYVPLPRSYLEEIDRLLSDYDPMDRAAFEDFQAKAKAANELTPDMIRMWFDKERLAISAPLPAKPAPKFTARNIG